MPLDPDELAGVCDLFGGLTRDELAGAVADLAARRGDDHDPAAHAAAVADARAAYALLDVDSAGMDGVETDDSLLVPGPRAFPTLPSGGEDLPHLLDAPRRDVPSDAVETALRARLAADVAALDDEGDAEDDEHGASDVGASDDEGDAADEDDEGAAGRDVEPPDPDVLIDVTYDAAALTGTDFADVRERIADAR